MPTACFCQIPSCRRSAASASGRCPTCGGCPDPDLRPPRRASPAPAAPAPIRPPPVPLRRKGRELVGQHLPIHRHPRHRKAAGGGRREQVLVRHDAGRARRHRRRCDQPEFGRRLHRRRRLIASRLDQSICGRAVDPSCGSSPSSQKHSSTCSANGSESSRVSASPSCSRTYSRYRLTTKRTQHAKLRVGDEERSAVRRCRIRQRQPELHYR